MGIGSWFTGQMFGGAVLHTVGSVQGKGPPSVGMELKVHVVESKNPQDGRLVGLELVAKSFLSYQMTPCTLSFEESHKLIELLQTASS